MENGIFFLKFGFFSKNFLRQPLGMGVFERISEKSQAAAEIFPSPKGRQKPPARGIFAGS